MLINKDAHTQLSQYPIFRQDQIAKLFEKTIFRIIISEEILSNWQIFDFYFVNKIKDLYTDKVYEKICAIIQVYKNNDKNLVLI